MEENILTLFDLDKDDAWEEERILIQEIDRSFAQKEIKDKALSVAASLTDMGMWQEPICIEAEQTAETLIFILGVIMSGNYYIPLSGLLPLEKKNQILDVLKPTLYCISAPAKQSKTNVEGISTLTFQETQQRIVTEDDRKNLKNIWRKLTGDSILYVIFTSGSTGTPKGIVKTHGAMVSFLTAYIKQFDFTREDVLGNQTPFYFDASAKDIYLTFLLRCRLFLIPQGMFVRPAELVEYLNRERVSVIQWVPSALSILSRVHVFRKIKPQFLRKVFFVGEVFPVKQLTLWMENLPKTEFINLYGASELAGICAYHVVEDTKNQSSIPIGRPLSNSELYLVSGGRVITKAGEVGEIYIKSDALAAGYLMEEAKTWAAFEENPLPQLPNGRYYKSGDLANYREDGALEYVSRKDFQIKHMGHRIELGEIEAAACEVGLVDNACCVYAKNKIVLFYEGCIQKPELLTHLKSRLMPYMIPNKVVALDAMPINANGKINRVYLKESLQ